MRNLLKDKASVKEKACLIEEGALPVEEPC